MAKIEEPFAGGNPYDEFQIGDQVEHPKWGVGTILFRSGSGANTKVIVVFPEEGQKKLALRFAKLRKIQEAKPSVPAPVPVPAPAETIEKKIAEPEEELEEGEEIEEVEDLGDDDKIPPPENLEAELPFDEKEEESFEDIEKDDSEEG